MTHDRIWLVGCKGMLGVDLADVLARRGLNCAGTDLECDITDAAALDAFAAGRGFSWIVNCAAYTAVDRAEDEEARARAINAHGAGNLAAAAARLGARMIQISTDYVFDGRASRPYLETDPVCPLGAYGRTKAEGERLVLERCPRAIVLRTAWLYGRHGRNFVDAMLRAMRERPLLKVVADQHGTPTHTATLCDAIAEIVIRGTPAPGIYHLTDGGETTWHGFASEIRACAVDLGLLPATCRIEPITTAEYPTRARRPAYAVLSKRKISAWLERDLPPWRETLAAYLRSLAADVSSEGSRQSAGRSEFR